MLSQTGSLARAAMHHVFPRTSFRLIHTRKMHDEIEVKLLPLLAEPARDAIDVGANVGRYTKPLSRLARHVHAFEPHPRLHRMLKASLPANVTVHRIALSDDDDVALLHVPLVDGRQDEGTAHLSVPETTERCVTFEVRTVALDSLTMGDVGFMKIDVEGHEARVLVGAERLIERCRPSIIIESEERHSKGGIDRIRSHLESRDYVGFFVLKRRLRSVAEFTSALQDPEILRRASPGTARESISYVNNFVFLPRERASDDFKTRCNASLSR